MSIQLVTGNILDVNTKYIAHQTNCVTKKSSNLAAAVFKRFPFADIYSIRTDNQIDTPGTIIVKGNGLDQRFVINMLGQFYPGAPKYPDSKKDGFEVRKQYFFQCLKSILLIEDLQSIAFPYRVGCGVAGGDWDFYYELLEKFAAKVAGRAEVLVVKLPEEP